MIVIPTVKSILFKTIPSVTYHPYVETWIATVRSSGSNATATTLAAMSTFMTALDAASLTSKIGRCNLFCGNDLISCCVPLIKTYGDAIDTNMNFVAANYTASTGLQGNGSNKYLKTGFVPSGSNMLLNSQHLSAYVHSGGTTANHTLLGSSMGTAPNPNYTRLDQTWGDGYDYYYSGPNVASLIVGVNLESTSGYYVGTREGPTAAYIYHNKNQYGPASGTNYGYQNQYPIYVFAWNDVGSVGGYESCRLGGYTIGGGFGSLDIYPLSDAMAAFQAART